MQPSVWVQGTVFALGIAQLFIFWYLYRRSSASGTHRTGQSGVTAVAPRDGSENGGRVACQNCATLNTGEFSYCRECVEALPRHDPSN